MDRISFVVLLFSVLGCVAIDGGSVETSWVVVTHDNRGIGDCGCTCPPIAKVRLQLLPIAGGSDPCVGRSECQFSCNAQSGATRFDIPPGTYAISLVPVGADGNDIPTGEVGTCRAAAGVDPTVREVLKGRVTQLDAVTLQADCAAECGGLDSTKVCSK